MRLMKLVPFVLLAFVLAACQLSDTPGEQNPSDDNQPPAPTPTVSVSSHEPEVGVEFSVTFAVYPALDYAVLDVLACSTGEEIEHWAYDERDELSPARDVTHTLSFDESRCLKLVYTVVEDGEDLPDTPVTLTVYVGGQDDDDDGNDDNGDDDDNDNDNGSSDPDACDRIDWFNVKLSSGQRIEDGDTVHVDGGYGFSLNWGVRSVDDVDVSLSHEGDEFFSSNREKGSESTGWDKPGEGTYAAVLDVENNGDDCRRRIRFEVVGDDNDGGSGDHDNREGRLEIQVTVSGGNADPDDFPVRIYDDDGDFVDTLRDDGRIWLDAERYSLRISDGPGDDYALVDLDRDCSRESSYRAEIDIVEDEYHVCKFDMEYEDDDDGGTGGGVDIPDDDEGVLGIRVYVDGGTADRSEFRVNVYDRDDDDDYVGALYDNRNRDTKILPGGRYLLRIDSGPYEKYSLDRVEGDCDPYDIGDHEARIRLPEGEERDCAFFMEYTGGDDDTPDASECTLVAGEALRVCDDHGEEIFDDDVISLDRGDHISIAWSASGVYTSTALQVYNRSQGQDEFYSTVSEGSRSFIFPTEIPSGNLEVIFTVYRTEGKPASRYPVKFTLKSN